MNYLSKNTKYLVCVKYVKTISLRRNKMVLTMKEANNKFEERFASVCKYCGEKLASIVEDYNLCLNKDCDDLNIYDDKGKSRTNV
jgi:hypothetical protein